MLVRRTIVATCTKHEVELCATCRSETNDNQSAPRVKPIVGATVDTIRYESYKTRSSHAVLRCKPPTSCDKYERWLSVPKILAKTSSAQLSESGLFGTLHRGSRAFGHKHGGVRQ
jgi:hypothetical protein